ncbi:MAG TPA: hypothetical protein VKT78_17960 [Fimbriimonadaceae bacterium]|nr:hypothetical protein [Fimbriimonadaceae bacterium]
MVTTFLYDSTASPGSEPALQVRPGAEPQYFVPDSTHSAAAPPQEDPLIVWLGIYNGVIDHATCRPQNKDQWRAASRITREMRGRRADEVQRELSAASPDACEAERLVRDTFLRALRSPINS